MIPDPKQRLLERFKTDPLVFGRICVPTMFTAPSPLFHSQLSNAYTDPVNNSKTVVIAPRGHAKTSIVACIFPLHHLMFDPGPKFVVLVSKTEGHAIRLLTTIKDVLSYSLPFRNFFGYWGEHSSKSWRNNEVILRDGSAIITRGTGQMVVGLKHIHQRPTLIVLDDPEDMMNTKTDEAMEHNLKWLLQSLIPARAHEGSRVIVIGTPQHQRCMVETLSADKTEGWTKFRYKALNGEAPYTALWPEVWSVDKLIQEREEAESIGRLSTFYREYQCEVIADETQLFKDEYLQYYTGYTQTDQRTGESIMIMTDKENAEVKRFPVNIFMGVDPAVSLSENADYTVIMPVAIDKERNIYVLPYLRGRYRPSETINYIVAKNRMHRPQKVNIESTAAQETFRDILRSLDGEIIRGLHTKNIPRDRKSKRYLDVLEPYFHRRKVHLLRNMDALVSELLSFGAASRHDDTIDALYWAVRGSYPPMHQVWDGDTHPEKPLRTVTNWKTA